MILTKNAARPGSEGGNGSNQLIHLNTAGLATQPRCTSMPDRGAARKERAEQLRLFSIDGAWTEPYTPPTRAGNDASIAAAVEGMTQ